ncbi:MAG: hypothetical protein BWK80_48180 [Desulfobacteraceae bacterium IS3]|nr:MAG: hypothetical protein BWK80_48180 [Desulfobacteraceae bacterium IS3]HAO19593.1 hypothetical protein [Desulfobacteraceae bacterium]
MKIRDNNKGFIHIFLMIVVVLLGIMSAIAIPKFTESQSRSRPPQIQKVRIGNFADAGQIK